jgi:DNA-binding XRE family transcriptional regulator
MPRRPTPPSTALGHALRVRRAGDSQAVASAAAGVAQEALSRMERGTHRPSYDTAKALAAWLGWTVEQVMEAAERPIEGEGR